MIVNFYDKDLYLIIFNSNIIKDNKVIFIDLLINVMVEVKNLIIQKDFSKLILVKVSNVILIDDLLMMNIILVNDELVHSIFLVLSGVVDGTSF